CIEDMKRAQMVAVNQLFDKKKQRVTENIKGLFITQCMIVPANTAIINSPLTLSVTMTEYLSM
ncbi:MAG: hypothetical protein RPU64_10550, partial [Candidatus Sedimenticola sp. (ex Thyasira tokunagai)]